MAKLVSKVYGEALFELALEKKTMDELEKEILFVRNVFREDGELLKFLNHPKISKDEKVKVIENIFKDKVSDDVVGFLVIIVQKDRYNEIDAIFEYFLSEVKEYKKIGTAYVTSAVPLSGQQKQKVEARLLETTEYVRLEMIYDCDAALIGGMVIRIGDRVVDSSIRTKLNTMAKELTKIQLG